MSDPNRWPLPVLVVAATLYILLSTAQAQVAKQSGAEMSISDPDGDHVRAGSEWFYRGRVVRGLPSAELRRRAYHAKLQLRTQRATAVPHANPAVSFSVGSWLPLGPVPLASDASGNGTQDDHQVAGRSTAVAIDQWNFGIDRAHAIRLLSLSAIIPPPVQWCRFSYV